MTLPGYAWIFYALIDYDVYFSVMEMSFFARDITESQIFKFLTRPNDAIGFIVNTVLTSLQLEYIYEKKNRKII